MDQRARRIHDAVGLREALAQGAPVVHISTAAARRHQCPHDRGALPRSGEVPRREAIREHAQAALGVVVGTDNDPDKVRIAIRERPQQYLWGYHRYKAPRPAGMAGDTADAPRPKT